MPSFSRRVLDFWCPPTADGLVVVASESLTIGVDPTLGEDRRISVLETDGGRTRVRVTPGVADRLDLWASRPQSAEQFRRLLNEADIVLHGADHLFYFAEPARRALIQAADREPAAAVTRRLTATDAMAFDEFQSSASEQDLDDAFVELGHWAVFGAFVGDRLVSAASAYPWGGAQIADIGVLTLPNFRGRGHARALVRSISRHALLRGHEPQYRCQLDNHASVAVAAASGLSRFGAWEVVSATSPV